MKIKDGIIYLSLSPKPTLTEQKYNRTLKERGSAQNMSGKGNSIYRSMMENFFELMKIESN